jgi:hypothetical protein
MFRETISVLVGQGRNINFVVYHYYNAMSTVITKVLDMDKLKEELDTDEKLQFLFVTHATPIENSGSERYHCKNGHFNFISNYMGFEPNTFVQIKCDECDEIIFEFKPFAVRTRDLRILDSVIVPHSCRDCKELTQSFHPDDDWWCRKGHVGGFINRENDCEDFDKKIRKYE